MTIKLLIKQYLEFLSLKGGWSGSSESTHVKYHIVGNHFFGFSLFASLPGTSFEACNKLFYGKIIKLSPILANPLDSDGLSHMHSPSMELPIFSSPEPKAQGELIVWDSSRCP